MADTDWENCYRTGDTQWDKGKPSPGLVDWLAAHPDLPRGSVINPGCGFGYDIREWAKAGFDAVGYDIAPSAVDGATAKTSEPNATFKLGDFLEDEPTEQYDWIFEHTFYCAVNPSRRPDYLNAIKRWLKPGGQFLAVHYFISDEDGPPFGTDHDEVHARFSDDFELLEDWVPRSYPNRTDLERMFWWRRKDRVL